MPLRILAIYNQATRTIIYKYIIYFIYQSQEPTSTTYTGSGTAATTYSEPGNIHKTAVSIIYIDTTNFL